MMARILIALLLSLGLTSTASAQAVLVPSPVPVCTNGDVLQWNTVANNFICTAASAISQPLTDALGILRDNLDGTKVLRIEVGGIATATTRVWTVPNVDLTFPTTLASLGTNTFTGLQTFGAGISVTGSATYTGSGSFGGNVSGVNGTFSGNVSGVNSTFTGTDTVGTLSATTLNVTGVGPHAIGATANVNAQLTIGGTFNAVSAANSSIGIRYLPTIGGFAGVDVLGILVQPTLVEAASGNHPLLAGLRVSTPAITAGAATVTNAASMFIEGAPAATVTSGNYALWVQAGASWFGGAITSTGAITATGFVAGSTGEIYWAGRSVISSPADGQLLIRHNSASDFGRLMLGGATSGFPSLRRSAATIDVVLADNSAYTTLRADVLHAWTAFSAGSNSAATGGIRLPNSSDIKARNAANTADHSLIYLDATDKVIVGSGTAASLTLLGGTGGVVNVSGSLASTGQITAPDGTVTSPGLRFAGGNNGIFHPTTNTVDIATNGNSRARFDNTGVTIADGYSYNFGSSTVTAADVKLFRGGPGVLELRNLTNPQELRVFNTFTDASNKEYATVRWSGTNLLFGTEKAGTGATRALRFIIGSAGVWDITTFGNIEPVTNAANNIGSSALRVREVWSAGYSENYVHRTASFTYATDMSMVSCDATAGAVVATLPAISGTTGRIYRIKKTDSSANACTLDGNGAETIDGAATQSVTVQNAGITVISTGNQWLIVK